MYVCFLNIRTYLLTQAQKSQYVLVLIPYTHLCVCCKYVPQKIHYTYSYIYCKPISVFVYIHNQKTHCTKYSYIHTLYTYLCICFTVCIRTYIVYLSLYLFHNMHTYIHLYMHSYVSTLMYKYVYTKHTYVSHWNPVVEIWRFWDLYVFRI